MILPQSGISARKTTCELRFLRPRSTEMRWQTSVYGLCRCEHDDRMNLRLPANLHSHQTRRILLAIATAPLFVDWNENGLQRSSPSLPETLSTNEEDTTSRSVDSHLAPFAPSRTCGQTIGSTSADFDSSSPPSSGEPPLPIAPDLCDPLPPRVPRQLWSPQVS